MSPSRTYSNTHNLGTDENTYVDQLWHNNGNTCIGVSDYLPCPTKSQISLHTVNIRSAWRVHNGYPFRVFKTQLICRNCEEVRKYISKLFKTGIWQALEPESAGRTSVISCARSSCLAPTFHQTEFCETHAMALASIETTNLELFSTIVRTALNRVCQFDIGTPEDAAAFLGDSSQQFLSPTEDEVRTLETMRDNGPVIFTDTE